MDDHEAAWLRDLSSDDEAAVIKALHRACPCSGSPSLWLRHKEKLRALKNDARERVREVALHLELDALDVITEADERANGVYRNLPGHSGDGQLRRPDLRQGYRATPGRKGHRRGR